MLTYNSSEVLEEILDLASNNWLSLEDVVKKIKLPRSKTMPILDFLADFKFIKFDSDYGKIKTDYAGLKLLELPVAYLHGSTQIPSAQKYSHKNKAYSVAGLE